MSEYSCKTCFDNGYIYTCLNCGDKAIYDSEVGGAVCDTCAILGDKQKIYAEKCNHCNIADIEPTFPKAGQKLQTLTSEQLRTIIIWEYNLKIPINQSYDIILPKELKNNKLRFFSYVKNEIQFIELDKIFNVEIVARQFTSIRLDSDLKGLKYFISEERNRYMFKDKEFIRLDIFEGYSWEKNKFDMNDFIKKANDDETNFLVGLTIKLNMVQKKYIFDSLYYDDVYNKIYFIKAIKKFEII